MIAPLDGALIQYASWGISGSIVSLPDLAPAVREVIAGTMAGTVASVSVPLPDGRRADRAMLRPLGWDGRSIGAIVALRSGRTFLAEDGSTLDEVARLAAIDLFATYASSRPSGAPPATAPPAAAAAPAIPVAAGPVPALRGLGPGTVLAATIVAQALAADGAIALQAAGAAASFEAATGWLALALAAAVQGLALLSLRRRWPARALLALLLIAFVASAMSVPLVADRPLVLALRVGEAAASLATALVIAGRLRHSPAYRP